MNLFEDDFFATSAGLQCGGQHLAPACWSHGGACGMARWLWLAPLAWPVGAPGVLSAGAAG